jgi:hypothetical protein
MGHYVVNETTRQLVMLEPLEVTEFASEEEARDKARELNELNLGDTYRATTLRDYTAWVVTSHHNHKRHIEELNTLRNAIETFLEEGYEGALDGDEFIEEHKALAEAVGFEYEEEKTYTIAVTVTAKHRRGYFINTYDFSVGVESDTSDVEVIDFDIDCVDEQ